MSSMQEPDPGKPGVPLWKGCLVLTGGALFLTVLLLAVPWYMMPPGEELQVVESSSKTLAVRARVLDERIQFMLSGYHYIIESRKLPSGR